MNEQAKCAECNRDMPVTKKMRQIQVMVLADHGPKTDVGFICAKCEVAVLMGGPTSREFN